MSATAGLEPTARYRWKDVAAVARRHAVDVDRAGRFPAEALEAMRAEGLLGALVPARFGGGGQNLAQAARACWGIAQACSSSAMILAMHHIQVACLARQPSHGPWQAAFLRRVAAEGLLLGSMTSEVGVGGAMRSSLCAVVPEGSGLRIDKRGTAISYGRQADALLVTARATPQAEADDQSLVVLPASGYRLANTGRWDAMGMRGTCSEAFDLAAVGTPDQVLPTPYAQISSRTMVPVAHLLWSALWAGIATDAMQRARAYLRGAARRSAGTPRGSSVGAARLVEAAAALRLVEARVDQALDAFDAAGRDGRPDTVDMNLLKLSASEACLAVVQQCMMVCGFAGYANDGPLSLSRHVRDLYSSLLMINNDRIRGNTEQLMLMHVPTGIGREP